MSTKVLHALSMFVVLCLGCLACIEANAQTRNQFRVGKFLVQVDLATLRINAALPPSGVILSTGNARQLEGKTLSGEGNIAIYTVGVRVAFRDIRLKVDGGALVATSGTVVGKAGGDISYNLDALGVRISKASIMITPGSARAKISVTVPVAFFSTGTTSDVLLTSDSSPIVPDGSINGIDFHGSASVSLKGSAYSARIRPTDLQVVRAGPAFTGKGQQPDSGVKLQGVASRGTVEMFSFSGTLLPNAKSAGFTLDVGSPRDVYPETNYRISLKKGRLSLKYVKAQLQDLYGSLEVDVVLPPAVVDEQGQSIQLHDVVLETDKSDALFGKVTLARRLRMGERFTLEPATNGAFAYFPKWPFEPGGSTYPDKHDCDTLFDIVHDPNRSGLTVFEGILHFDAPQVKTASTQPSKIRAAVVGAVTLTPWGLTGDIRGSGYSFVPEDQDIAAGATPSVLPRATWEQIQNAGDTRPVEPQQCPVSPPTSSPTLPVSCERFRLADLRILDMKLQTMHACTAGMDPPQATVRYVVHFPFPSFVDLAFEDSSLDDHGLFAQAKGPIATVSPLSPPTAQDIATNNVEKIMKTGTTTPNPDTYILWAWKLPVSFADRGVIADYLTGPGPSYKTNVTVTIDESRRVNQEILNSELWLKPLFSHNSAVKSGVRFSANMNSQTGNFRLTDLDDKPFMLRIYAPPGSERSSGFAVNLKAVANNGIVLADPGTNPSSREYDFQWNGSIQFPFFSDEPPETWQGVSFNVKNLVPQLTSPLALQRDSRKKNECNVAAAETSPRCEAVPFTGPTMRVAAINISYTPDANTFTSNEVRGYDAVDSQTELDINAVSLRLTSYTNGILLTKSEQDPKPYPVIYPLGNESDYYPDECGDGRRDVRMRRLLTNWIDSSAIRDLICYDSAAICIRGKCPSCSGHFIYGTYEVRSRKCQSAIDCLERTILSIPDTKYYPDTGQIDANATQATLQSDELEESKPIVINIPSAQFAFSEDGRFMDAAFGATLATVAESLPYEGELRFMINNHCGYFYFQGAGSFTYFARFSGQTFVVHAPYRFFSGVSTVDPVFPGVSSILEDLRIRALSASIEDFTVAAGFSGLDPNTIITGVFASGTAGRSFGAGIVFGKVALGPSAYLYQLQDSNEGPMYKIGTFVNVRAVAQVGISQTGVGVEGYATLPSASFETADTPINSLPSLMKSFEKGEFNVSGTLRLTGCASALFGHCAAGISFAAAYSSNSGFDLRSPDVCGDCGTGGCSGTGKCGQ